MAAAAEVVLMIESICEGLAHVPPGGGGAEVPRVLAVAGEALVCTVGSLTPSPGQVTWGVGVTGDGGGLTLGVRFLCL
jgi:hypothetical protein